MVFVERTYCVCYTRHPGAMLENTLGIWFRDQKRTLRYSYLFKIMLLLKFFGTVKAISSIR